MEHRPSKNISVEDVFSDSLGTDVVWTIFAFHILSHSIGWQLFLMANLSEAGRVLS